MPTSKTQKLETKLKKIICPACQRKRLIPRFPGARFKAFRCMNCGVTGRLKRKEKG